MKQLLADIYIQTTEIVEMADAFVAERGEYDRDMFDKMLSSFVLPGGKGEEERVNEGRRRAWFWTLPDGATGNRCSDGQR